MNECPAVLPNPSFRTQLLQHELSLFHTQSFEDEGKMQEFMASISNCWTKKFTPESDFDRTPVHGASQGENGYFLQSEYPSEETATTQAVKPKKTFLKRGTGSTATEDPANNLPRSLRWRNALRRSNFATHVQCVQVFKRYCQIDSC
jgi:hypothetical protein